MGTETPGGGAAELNICVTLVPDSVLDVAERDRVISSAQSFNFVTQSPHPAVLDRLHTTNNQQVQKL